MTVEEQRIDIKAKVAAKREEYLARLRAEHLARLAAMSSL